MYWRWTLWMMFPGNCLQLVAPWYSPPPPPSWIYCSATCSWSCKYSSPLTLLQSTATTLLGLKLQTWHLGLPAQWCLGTIITPTKDTSSLQQPGGDNIILLGLPQVRIGFEMSNPLSTMTISLLYLLQRSDQLVALHTPAILQPQGSGRIKTVADYFLLQWHDLERFLLLGFKLRLRYQVLA